MWGRIFWYVVNKGSKEAQERLDRFLTLFNNPPLSAIEGEEANSWEELAYDAVKAELALPGSAAFGETYVRHCADERVRAAGFVEFAGSDEVKSSNWFLVEFDASGNAKLFRLVDDDPILLEEVPPSFADVILPVDPTPKRRGYSSLPLFWRLFWPVVIVTFVAVIFYDYLRLAGK